MAGVLTLQATGAFSPLDTSDLHSNTTSRYKVIMEQKEISPITSLNFHPSQPSNLFVTDGTRVLIYDLSQEILVKKLAFFKDPLKSLVFRGDGGLFGVGDDTGKIRILESGRYTVLRRHKPHDNAVYALDFSFDKTHFLSGGDDSAVVYYDIGSGTSISKFKIHSDFVRTVEFAPEHFSSIFASGSFDGSVLLTDLRAPKEKSVRVEAPGLSQPVQKVHWNNESNDSDLTSTLAAASGAYVYFWDVRLPSQPLYTREVCPHAKTIMDFKFGGVNGKDIVSCGLDSKVTRIDYKTGVTGQTFITDAAPLCIAYYNLNGVDKFAYGCSDSTWCVRALKELNSRDSVGNIQQPIVVQSENSASEDNENISVSFLPSTQKITYNAIEALLRKFMYSKALDVALKTSDLYTVSVLQELINRKALYVALRSRQTREEIVPLISFLMRNCSSAAPNLFIIYETAKTFHEVINWTAVSADVLVLEALRRFSKKLSTELSCEADLITTRNLLDTVLSI